MIPEEKQKEIEIEMLINKAKALEDEDIEKAVSIYEEAIELGSTYAMNYLASLYFIGNGVKKNYRKAISLFQRAADLNDCYGIFNLGMCYYQGYGVDCDSKKAMIYLLKAAEMGNTGAMFLVANQYKAGDGINKSYAEALKWYKKAANLGHSSSMKSLANLYYNGVGVEKDIQKSIYYYQQAACNGDATAKKILAGFYEEGEIVPQDKEKAKCLYQESFDMFKDLYLKGDYYACNMIGDFYFEGCQLLNIPQDYTQAFNWYKDAADNAYIAMNKVGVFYNTGLGGVEQNYEKAVYYFSKAAERHDVHALFNLAQSYYLGRGVERNVVKAAELFAQSARLGHSGGQSSLGKLYMEGDGVAKDYQKAVYWLSLAADSNQKDSFYPLAKCYMNGWGVDEDANKAFSLVKKAADAGDLSAINCQAEFLMEGIGTVIDYNQAATILLDICHDEQEYKENHVTSILQDDDYSTYIDNPLDEVYLPYYAKAYYLLAHLYYSGNGVKKKDPSEAIRLLNVAENLGNEEALKLKNKILNEVSSDEVNNINKLNIEIELYDRPWGAGKAHKTGKYNIFLRRPDGSELPPLWFNTADAKFLYLVLLYSLKYKTPVQLQLFENKSIELANLARFLCVEPKNQSRHIDWIEGFDYSGESTRIDKSIGDGKKNEKLTPEEIKICQVFSKGQGKNKPWIKTLNFSKDQIIYPKSPELDSLFDKIFSKDNSYE